MSAPLNEPDPEEQDARDMQLLAGGRSSALNALMDRHAQKLLQYLYRCLQSLDDAEDLCQETFVRVFQHRTSYDPRQKFSTWLYCIASNLIKDRYRWRSRHPQVSIDAEREIPGGNLAQTLPDSAASPSERLQTAERADEVRAAIGSLPAELREPLILAEYEERSQAEISVILGCTVKAVETRLYRARLKLRERLARLL